MTIDSARLDDAGVYSCVATNFAGSDYKSTVIRVFNRKWIILNLINQFLDT